MQSDEMHAAVAKLLKNELPRPEWRCAVHQGCTGQRFFASGRDRRKNFRVEAGQGRGKIPGAGRGNS